jgi:hypothetical protein
MVFWADLVTRVELVTYCNDRLHEFNPIGHAINEAIADEGRVDLKSPFVTGFRISRASTAQSAHQRWVLETDAVTLENPCTSSHSQSVSEFPIKHDTHPAFCCLAIPLL